MCSKQRKYQDRTGRMDRMAHMDRMVQHSRSHLGNPVNLWVLARQGILVVPVYLEGP